MNIEEIREYCLLKKGVKECFPFDVTTLVFKVADKMFLLTALDKPLQINIKCEPELAIELRERYAYVIPGYHMSKKHWNTILLDNIVNEKLVYKWIDDSYDLVVESLSKKDKIQYFL